MFGKVINTLLPWLLPNVPKDRILKRWLQGNKASQIFRKLTFTPFFYKKSIFDPRPENGLSFFKKIALKNCLAIA